MIILFWILLYFVIGLIGALGLFVIDYWNVRHVWTPDRYMDSTSFEELIGSSIFVFILWPVVLIILGVTFGYRSIIKYVLKRIQSISKTEE